MKKMLAALVLALVPLTVSTASAAYREPTYHPAAAPQNPDLICFVVWGHRICW